MTRRGPNAPARGPANEGFPAAGNYKVLVSLSPRGYVTVAVLHRVWNGADVFDRRTDLVHAQIPPGDPDGVTVRGLLGLALRLLERR